MFDEVGRSADGNVAMSGREIPLVIEHHYMIAMSELTLHRHLFERLPLRRPYDTEYGSKS